MWCIGQESERSGGCHESRERRVRLSWSSRYCWLWWHGWPGVRCGATERIGSARRRNCEEGPDHNGCDLQLLVPESDAYVDRDKEFDLADTHSDITFRCTR